MPSGLVVTVDFAAVAGFVTTIVAPGTTAPEASVILPTMDPRVSCDQTAPQTSSASIDTRNNLFFIFASTPFSYWTGLFAPRFWDGLPLSLNGTPRSEKL